MTEKRFKLVDRNGIYQILDLHKKGRHILTGEENVELLNNLHEENQELKEDTGGDDGVFNFNSNCAKLYQIRSVSPNGVIRLGKKNYKVKWRMKDVREINNELPTREEFNREEYNKLRNKFHTKHWCGDVVFGRIIYNIYEGTFDDYL